MCQVGDSNLSHASLASATTLTSLWELPKTNLNLYHEISGSAVEPSTGLEDDFADENDSSIADPDGDGSDILTDVIISHIVADGVSMVEGFKSNKDGRIIWTGVTEETNLLDTEVERLEAIAVVEAPQGCGHWAKVRNLLYNEEWEMHWILHKYKPTNSLFYLFYIALIFCLFNTSKRTFFEIGALCCHKFMASL